VGAGGAPGEVPAEPAEPAEPATPETLEAETPELEAETPAPEPDQAAKPEGEETPPPPEAAKPAEPSEADKLIEELNLFDEKVPPARLALLKKDPAVRDAFYRDRAFQHFGFTPKLAEAFYDRGITTSQDLEHVVQGNETLTTFDRHFSDGTEEGAARLIKSLFDISAPNARNVFKTAWKVLPLTDPDFAAEAKSELFDIALRQMGKDFEGDEDRTTLLKAFTQMLDEWSVEAPKKLAPRAADRELKAKLDKYEQRERERAQESVQQVKSTANDTAGKAVLGLVAKKVASKFQPDFPLFNEIIEKTKKAVDQKLFQVAPLRQQLRAVLADSSLTPQQKAERYSALVAPVAERFLDREFVRVSKPYTANAVTTNKAQLEKARAVAQRKEIGSGTAAPVRPAAPTVDYRKMSDEQIVESLVPSLRKR
jgi:hypothetical protein